MTVASNVPEQSGKDPDFPPGSEITVHVTGRVVAVVDDVLMIEVDLADGSRMHPYVYLTAAGVSTTIPGLTRACAWPGCHRSYSADVGPDTSDWLRLRGFTVLCPDHKPL